MFLFIYYFKLSDLLALIQLHFYQTLGKYSMWRVEWHVRYRFAPRDVALPLSVRPCGGIPQPGQRQQSVGNSSSSAPYISTDPRQRRTHSSPSVLLLAPSVRPSSILTRLYLRLRVVQATSASGKVTGVVQDRRTPTSAAGWSALHHRGDCHRRSARLGESCRWS